MTQEIPSNLCTTLAPRLMRAMGEITRFHAPSLDDRLTQMLATACRELGMDRGDITRTDCHGQHILHAHGPDELIDRPASVSATVVVDGQSYGVLSFVCKNAPNRVIDPIEREFIHLMTQWATGEIERETIRAQLLNSEVRFRRAFDNAAVCKAIISPEGRFIQVNPALSEMLGYSERELIGASFVQFTHPNDINRCLDLLKLWNDNESTLIQTEHSYIHKNGRVVRAKVYIAAVQDEHHRAKYAIVEFVDISRQWSADEERRRIFDLSIDVIAVADVHGRILQVNPAFSRLLGYTQEEAVGKLIVDLAHPDDLDPTRAAMSRLLRGNRIIAFEHRMVARDGTPVWLSWNASLLPEKELMFGVARDITQAKHDEQKLRHAAMHDNLTGLPNRTLLSDRLTQAIKRVKRDLNYKYALLFLDLNGFKNINDAHGHAVGDQILVEVASRLRGCLRDLDTAAYTSSRVRADDLPVRFGGDEFVVLLDGMKACEDATLVAERLKRRIAEPYHAANIQIRLTTSVGIIHSDHRFESATDAMIAADKAMYEHKRTLRDGDVAVIAPRIA